jgi:hypothetical protein
MLSSSSGSINSHCNWPTIATAGRQPGALDRPAVFAQVFHVARVKLIYLPRTDPVILLLSPNRRVQVAHRDPI